MSPERWKQIDDLLQATLDVPEQERRKFLRRACADDCELEQEVQSLLNARMQAGDFLEKPAIEIHAYAFHSQMSLDGLPATALKSGQVISHYRIQEEIGSGGMGVVYKAQDVRLHRWVALKFLPHPAAQDKQALARFQREARAASSLSHPNICTVFDIGEEHGRAFIAMEYLQGATLKQRLAEGPLALSLLLTLSLEITDALEAAHANGIVHRDIKPANILITPQSHAKVLDFGLAKTSSPQLAAVDATHEQATLPGTTMGTIAYMSPEQASCEELDSRTDLFSFGAVLYEMATGRQAFGGQSTALIFDAILNGSLGQPSLLRPDLPARLDEIILKALEKDRAARYQHAAEIHRELELLKQDLDSRKTESADATSRRSLSPPVSIRKPRRLGRIAVLTAAAVCLFVLGIIALRSNTPLPQASNYVQITNDGQAKQGPVLTDGLRLYFAEGSQNHRMLAQVSVSGGETTILRSPLETPYLMDIAPSRYDLLAGSLNPGYSTTSNLALWVLALPAGGARRIGGVVADDATWSPDGREIAYVTGNHLYRCRNDGSEGRELATLPGAPSWIRWSPDGARLRLTLTDAATGFSSIWEVSADGKMARPILPGWNQVPSECCGNWTPDDRYFVFQSTQNGKTEVWAMKEKRGLLAIGAGVPVRLTAGQMNSLAPVVSPDGKKLYVIGQQLRGELAQYDSKSGEFVPYLSGISAEFADFSRDRKWVTYVSFPERTLWRSRMDGSDRLQLTLPPVQATVPRWSPDGKRIAYFDAAPGKPWKIYVISADGGTPEPLLQESRNQMDPNWSPDGNSLIFSYFPIFEKVPPEKLGVYMVDLRTREVKKLPGSDGLWSPRWSLDGRHIVARSLDSHSLMLFNFQTQTWTELVRGAYFGMANWSADGQYVYYLRRGLEAAVLRVRIADGSVEEIASLSNLRQTGFRGGFWSGLAPDDSPLVLRDTGTQEIYALDLEAP